MRHDTKGLLTACHRRFTLINGLKPKEVNESGAAKADGFKIMFYLFFTPKTEDLNMRNA